MAAWRSCGGVAAVAWNGGVLAVVVAITEAAAGARAAGAAGARASDVAREDTGRAGTRAQAIEHGGHWLWSTEDGSAEAGRAGSTEAGSAQAGWPRINLVLASSYEPRADGG